MRKVLVKDNNYGCFTAYYVCKNCEKVLFKEGFSWDRQHIGIGEQDKIEQYMDIKAVEKQMYFCFKCGTKIAESEE